MPCRLSLLLLFCCASFSFADENVLPDAKISYEKDIRPIFKAACFHCHGEEEELQGSLDVRLRRMLVQGGDSGPVIVSGKSSESYLIERIKSGEMPPSEAGKPLAADQIELISKWIDLGAPTLRSEPESLPRGLVITEDDRNWWSFQPVVRPDVP
ncbi:MAG TPA: c-type cytochrome domain-containing protein, partial [Planctomycetaceae bacterium]|nr:c-type cytochrome domain-containing protein [Planctomycetaceae bacterium]